MALNLMSIIMDLAVLFAIPNNHIIDKIILKRGFLAPFFYEHQLVSNLENGYE